MPGASARVQRVADQIQRDLASLIQMEVSDPRVGMVSVTGVEVSRDLAYAKVFFTVLGKAADTSAVNHEEVEQNQAALNKASGYLRSLLAKRLQIRSVPKLTFVYDGSVERGQQLSSLIDEALAADREQHEQDD